MTSAPTATTAQPESTGGGPARAAVGSAIRVLFLISTAVMAVVHGAALALIIPHLAGIYRDYGVALPSLTRALIAFSRWTMGDTPGQRIPGALPLALGVGALVAALVVLSRRRSGLVLLMLVNLASMAMLGVIIVAMYLPMVSMIESVQGGAKP
jgi:type II secretory pathway component PulF